MDLEADDEKIRSIKRKWLLILLSFFVAYSNPQTCYDQAVQACNANNRLTSRDDLKSCNSKFPSFTKNIGILQKYANHQIEKSFDYLFLSINLGSYQKIRPGCGKQFRALFDKSWNNGIELIKDIGKRGGAHNFHVISKSYSETQTFDLNEIDSLALALDYEKTLTLEAHHIHEIHSNAHRHTEYDPEVAHFIEEEFIEVETSTIRKLSGYITDLKELFKDADDISLHLYFFDEYLNKQ